MSKPEGSEVIKAKRAPTKWAMAVKEHMSKGGKFPKKGSADHEAVMKIMGEAPAVKKEIHSDKATPKAIVEDIAKEVITEKAKELPIKEAETKKKVVRKPRVKAEKVSAESAIPAKPEIVAGPSVATAHIIPMLRVGVGHHGFKLPFGL